MELAKSKNFLQNWPVWQIAKINLRHNFLFHFGLAVFILVLTPVLFGTTNLDTAASAVPLEMFVSLIGIILLTPVFQPEQNAEIEDVIESKYVSGIYVHIIRTVYSVISLILLIAAFIVFMRMRGCSITEALLFGAIADALFLGSMGLVMSAITNNTAVSYMPPLLYYALNYSGGSKLGNFYLFSMMGGEYTTGVWLFGTGVILNILAILIKGIKKKFR